MRKIKQYRLVWEDGPIKFEKLVNEFIKAGRDLYGFVQCDGGRLFQAMVIYE